jgi:hypothetical protein
MFDELARLRFFIPNHKKGYPKYNDKYPVVVMETLGKVGDNENKCIIRGKFPDRNNAEIFLNALRTIYAGKMREEMAKVISQTVEEQNSK